MTVTYAKKNTAVFELVQLVVVLSTMHTCMVFLDPYIKGFLFVFFGSIWGVWAEPYDRTVNFHPFAGSQK